MKSLLVIFSIQFSILLSIVSFSSNAHAGILWSVDEIYHLGEVLHSSRYDYDKGMEISFKRYLLIENKSSSNCEASNELEIYNDISSAVSNHMSFYYDDEYDFESALSILRNKLSVIEDVKKCSMAGKKVFFDESNNFIVSYKLL